MAEENGTASDWEGSTPIGKSEGNYHLKDGISA